ncbi:MAG: 3-isopropylmalate dehydratase small subunit [Sphingobium sp.]
MARPKTLYEKIWDAHVVERLDDGTCLLLVDRQLIYEGTSRPAFEGLRAAGRTVRRPAATLAMADHMVPTRNRAAMSANAFAAHRWNDDLSPRPDFILNQPPYDRAGTLIARDNFGCGSSREMAVWALMGIGIGCVIAPSFGDIFFNNCFKNGFLPVRLPTATVERLLDLAEAMPGAPFTVNLETQAVLAPDGSILPFEVGAYQRDMLLRGLDEIAVTLDKLPAIEAREAAYFGERPWLA